MRSAAAAALLLLALAPAPARAETREVRGKRLGLIHPLLDTNPDREFRELRSFRHKVERLLAVHEASGTLTASSFYFRDLDNGPILSIRGAAPFRPASLLKLPVLMAFLKRYERSPDALRAKLRLRKAVETGLRPAFPPSVALEPGREYPIHELLTAMMARSDNDALATLIGAIEEKDYLRVFDDLGLREPNIRDIDDPVTVQEYAAFFRILYNASYLTREDSQRALEFLAKSEFTRGLAAGVPAGTIVAHKFGEAGKEGSPEKQLHDCGIVYHPRSPYLLCVMTKGRDVTRLAGVIADLSALVWREVDGPAAARRP